MKKITGTIILYCGCSNKGQDKLYGKGNRLHTITNSYIDKDGKLIANVKCSSCRNVLQIEVPD